MRSNLEEDAGIEPLSFGMETCLEKQFIRDNRGSFAQTMIGSDLSKQWEGQRLHATRCSRYHGSLNIHDITVACGR